MEGLSDLSKMKVADLKKHLKTRGLSVTGNKNELVDRLLEALQTNNGGLDGSMGADDEEFDEEEILGGADVTDVDKITQEEEAAALAGTLKVKGSAITNGTNKKVSLKRSEVSVEETKSVDPSGDNKENAEAVEPKHKVIKLSEESDEATKKSATTDEDRKKSRAERFQITVESTPTPATKPGRAPKLSMETGGTDVDKLKKRAERFGEVVSKTLTKAELADKKTARAERFKAELEASKDTTTDAAATTDADATTDAESTETKVSASNKNLITAPSGDEAKSKRAQRFAAS